MQSASGAATVATKRSKPTPSEESKTVRISGSAYKVARKIAGLRGEDLGDCISELILTHGPRVLKTEAKKLIDDIDEK